VAVLQTLVQCLAISQLEEEEKTHLFLLAFKKPEEKKNHTQLISYFSII
jgi:hypothetical protein